MANIYFADDEKDIREIVAAFLISDGHRVTAFETGDALLDAFQQKPCELVLLDIMMPGTDGIGILTALRKISRVPVILLTAKDSDSDFYSGLSLGSDDESPYNFGSSTYSGGYMRMSGTDTNNPPYLRVVYNGGSGVG